MTTKQYLGIMALALTLGLAGCATQTHSISTNPHPVHGDDCQTVNEMDFLDCMVRKTRCTVADAVRAVTILIADEDVGQTYSERYQFLLDRGVVRPEWDLQPDRWIDRGTLAYMLLRTAGIRGGVNMQMFGSAGLGDRRYAYREMRYRNLMQQGVDYHYVSGPELVTALGNVDRWMQDR